MTPLPCPALRQGQTLLRLIEPDVSDEMDAGIRELLSTCFTKTQDTIFRTQRFWQERPARHYVVREANGRLIAHANYHDKRLGCEPGEVRIGGVGDVCVHPDARGQGLVRAMLMTLHQELVEQGIPFGMLFGDAKVYHSSGYRPIENPLHYRELGSTNWTTKVSVEAMIRVLGTASWPQGTLDLRGPLF
jgi:predicted acetyltransferase